MICCNIRNIKIGITLVYALVFGFMLLYDQPLKPEVSSILKSIPEKVDQTDNLYCAMLGFFSPAGADIHAFGAKKIEQDRISRAISPKKDIPADDNSKRLTIKGKLPTFYEKSGSGLRQFIVREPAKVEALLEDNRELMLRYNSLRRYTRFEEPLFLGVLMPLPVYAQINDVQRLEQLRLIQAGNTADVIRFAREDLAFWHKIANNTRTLLGKLIAGSAIRRDYFFLADFASGAHLGETEWKVVTTELLQPLPMSVLSLAPVFPAEFYCMQDALALGFNPYGSRTTRLLEPLFAKRQMTINALYDGFATYMKQSEQSAQELAQYYKKQRDMPLADMKYGEPLNKWLINPGGEMMIGMAMPNFLSYLERSHRVEAVRRLALLKLQIVRQKVSDHDIPEFIARSGKELSDPFSGNPMSWDAKNRKIFFKRVDVTSGTVDMYLE